MSQARDLVEQKGNQIVHIRGDSDSDLEALFNAIINPTDSQVPLTVPMRLRKLPNSFFKPPETGSKTSQSVSHSRESSTDSTSAPTCFSPNTTPTQASSAVASPQSPSPQQAAARQATGAAAAASTGLPVHHPRAHSSPASLQQSLAAGTGQQQHQHLRQQSYDITDDVPLPPGWEMAKTASGQRYFLNHITQTTTWEDPRKKMSLSAVNLSSSGGSPSPPINPLSPQNLGPLPDGWEQASTPEGEIYFINHQSRTTSWFDPRIPMHLQRPAVLQQALQNPQPPSLLPNAGPQATAPQPPPTTQQPSTIQQRQQRVRLQRLQMERERLRMRQQEIMRQLKHSGVNTYGQLNLINNLGRPNYMDREQARLQQQDVLTQEMLIRQSLGEGLTSPSSTDMPPVTTTDIDPFLGGSDFHSRQESGDSGVGMSTNYSLPHTPEDFLSTMDDSMDPVSDDGSQCGQPTSDLSALDLQGSDLTGLGDTNNMDSDDLEPSLQEELSSDFLNDVEALLSVNRMDSELPTWI